MIPGFWALWILRVSAETISAIFLEKEKGRDIFLIAIENMFVLIVKYL